LPADLILTLDLTLGLDQSQVKFGLDFGLNQILMIYVTIMDTNN